MKIGIVTYHRSHNFGALLQSIAMRVTLEKMGNEVYYVDYWPGYHKRMYAIVNTRMIFRTNLYRSLRYVLSLPRGLKNKLLRYRRALNFIQIYIEPYCKSITEEFDVLLYGSDQIWRKQPELNDYNPVYFGQNNFKAPKHVSYAASMGKLPTTSQDLEKVRKLVSKLDSLSVREKDLGELLVSFGFKDVNVHLDPTLLLTREEWDSVVKPSPYKGPRYALFYDLQPGAFDNQQIINFVKDRNLVLKRVYGGAIRNERENQYSTISADSFLDLIRNADFVFTSSFHGLVFSIIYGKPFYTSLFYNPARVESILSFLGLQDYFLPIRSEIPNDYRLIDYQIVFDKLEQLREKSVSYLQHIG